ncbi:DUF6213 family protein [Streptomyces sp. NPDC012769]|uniref:DUF6213 family protein n=1 Tax=Streptomyces sp. NPDC012769 TaxID=3364848 RepID=UPI003680C21B
MNAPTSFIVLADGHLLVPADQMTGLLRRVAAGWLQATDQGYEDHDPATVLSLATGLMEIADQIDAECIGLMPLSEADAESDADSGAKTGPEGRADAAPDDGAPDDAAPDDADPDDAGPASGPGGAGPGEAGIGENPPAD